MDQHGLSMMALHRFLDTTRSYLELARTMQLNKTPQLPERRSTTRLLTKEISGLPAFQKTECRESAPA